MKRMTVMLLAALAAVYLMPLFTVGVGGGKAPELSPRSRRISTAARPSPCCWTAL